MTISLKNNSSDKNYDFEVASMQFDALVKYEAINRHFSLHQLLEDFGVDVRRTNMFCPFHYDEDTGKPSAKYHTDSDLLYCFSESKTYSAYHALKILYNANMETKFIEAWTHLSMSDREEILAKYSKEGDKKDTNGKSVTENRFVDPYWNRYSMVHSKFRNGEVDFKQHKNALFKIFGMIYEEEFNKLKVHLKQQELEKQRLELEKQLKDEEGEFGFL